MAQVLVNLALLGVAVAPLGPRLEGIAVQAAFNIATTAGVSVVAPGAAHIVAFVENLEIGFTCLEQLNTHAQA